jgi:hypothetical protein
MGLIEDELDEIRRGCENQIPMSRVVTAIPAMLRVEIERTPFKKIICCLLFPPDYPNMPILTELKSKHLAPKLLDRLTQLIDREVKEKVVPRPQAMWVLKFVAKFLEDTPLCVCSDEIAKVRSLLGPEDTIKLSQKSSTLTVTVTKEKYFLSVRCAVPDDYPLKQVDIKASDCNFPRVFRTWFVENAKELARRCVEAPKKPKPNAPKFESSPSLETAVCFLVTSVQRYPVEACQVCRQRLFPSDPDLAIHNEKAAAHVERVYCGHAYHHDCLILYMRTPPFEVTILLLHKKDIIVNPQGGKRCLGCNNRIYHEKWKVTPELAEARSVYCCFVPRLTSRL